MQYYNKKHLLNVIFCKHFEQKVEQGKYQQINRDKKVHLLLLAATLPNAQFICGLLRESLKSIATKPSEY